MTTSMTSTTIDTPQLLETTSQPVALLHLTVPASEIRSVMGPGLAEVNAAITAQGLTPSGPWFTHHLRRPADTFDFEICVPVSSPIQPAGRVVPGQWPAMRVARTIHNGGYEFLGAAWAEFDAWIRKDGHSPAADLWERYLVGPESSPDPAAWRTELSRPLVAAS